MPGLVVYGGPKRGRLVEKTDANQGEKVVYHLEGEDDEDTDDELDRRGQQVPRDGRERGQEDGTAVHRDAWQKFDERVAEVRKEEGPQDCEGCLFQICAAL